MPKILKYPYELINLHFPDMINLGPLNKYNNYNEVLEITKLIKHINENDIHLMVTMFFKKNINGVSQCYPLFKEEFTDLKETEKLYCTKNIQIYCVDKKKYIANTEPIEPCFYV